MIAKVVSWIGEMLPSFLCALCGSPYHFSSACELNPEKKKQRGLPWIFPTLSVTHILQVKNRVTEKTSTTRQWWRRETWRPSYALLMLKFFVFLATFMAATAGAGLYDAGAAVASVPGRVVEM